MHELSIAMSVIDVVEEELCRHPNAVALSVHLKVGPLSGVEKEALLSAYNLAREASSLKECQMKIEDVPIVAWCPQCQRETVVESILSLHCPACGATTPEVRKGRELEVFAMEISQ